MKWILLSSDPHLRVDFISFTSNTLSTNSLLDLGWVGCCRIGDGTKRKVTLSYLKFILLNFRHGYVEFCSGISEVGVRSSVVNDS